MPDQDMAYMQQALSLAKTNLGQTWPNPSVGAVVVKNNVVIGQGCTARGGRPHAETEALTQADLNARGATLYVTLEPCSHHGKTPPCVDAIISAGIARCVIACRDPHKNVNGAGIAKLKEAGIEIVENMCAAEAKEINRGFFSVVEKKRPYIALKIATSADGKIAYPTHSGKKWITGNAARNEVHGLRSEFDAVLTGIGTVLADDPLLTVRLQNLEHKSPVRVVLDRKHRLPATSKLIQSKNIAPLWVLDSPTLESAIEELTEKGITRLLVEAGQGLNTALINSYLVDSIYWFKAPFTIGEDGLDAFADKKTLNLLEQWKKVDYIPFPPDQLEIFEPCSPAS
ncbi:MAG: bifunctional diaminohydroxyphosphoribosylaminopyrimidine deaminase/5-amino-6-(5-phosphoribosylamino)uracil reductase RibD [Alphaproteobacteria bacterium]